MTNTWVMSLEQQEKVAELLFTDGILDKNKYLDILKENLTESAVKMAISDSYKFYQDNDPKHESRNVQEYLLYNCLKILDTLS
uniref:Uncharacterized protein n=1 Tax=Vespula pensylvanica TaxID=30213 RepID=A0A834JQY0_VESPE|nr:hypothetical protein H0235_017469 [Vespula pensylvanica]